MRENLSDWFCLKEGRSNFKPNVRTDSDLLFCHIEEIQDQVQSSIERSFSIGEPVKMIIYGDWGVGKTHAVHHVSWWLKNHADYSAKTVFVEVGDINKKSRFDVLIRPFLDEIGMDEIRRLVHEYNMNADTNVYEGLKAVGVGNNIANSYFKFMMSPPTSTPLPVTEQAFEHLKGGAVKDGAASGLSSKLEQSKEFYDVLVALGHLYETVDNKNLIFIADEAAKLEDLESDDATASHWTSTNRLIFDDANNYFGFIYTLAARGGRNLPQVLTDSQIVNRLGKQNMIELNNLSAGETSEFLKNLVEKFVDEVAVKKLAADGALGEDYDSETYPFTKEAHARFIDYWKRNQEDAKPRDITDQMNDVAFIALKKNHRLITETDLEERNL